MKLYLKLDPESRLSGFPENPELSFAKFEFHIAAEIRKKYGVPEELFSIAGNVVLANFHQTRVLAQQINSKRGPEFHVKPGELNAAGLLDEIFHFIFRIYETQYNPGVFGRAIDQLNNSNGEENVRRLLSEFVSIFPPLEVYKGQSSVLNYLESFAGSKSNYEITLEEFILLYFANINPANNRLLELFDKNYLSNPGLFDRMINSLDEFFRNEKKMGPEEKDIFSFLSEPLQKNPYDLEAQLDFIRERWGVIIEEKFLRRILTGKDFLKEDKSFGFFGGGGEAPVFAPKYKGKFDEAEQLVLGKSGYKYALDSYKDYDEPEQFTPDTDWMPNVILLAKNAFVWLDQLSKKYGRHIHRLDQIPDEELDYLVRSNFNGLWLIGIWERSNASKKIKHILGNIDAVASAYSLHDYHIAGDLGGDEAYHNLNERAKKRGIRLASDMVPNHTGIFSQWVIDHPEYFIQSDYPPFPNYKFTGPDLSDDGRVQLRIEDGYWSRSDAAVVFQRIDNVNGEVKYIYHGNDGTNMPWNDTAQLNMLKKEVREAVIGKIFEVARKFSIIRFDAAMTLTKRHFSRLWYPQPGTGGDIPSRADYALSREEFDFLFPEEFWREVVDRIKAEMPETLLLAEAFWLMEGYFVRSLGMHRVYNSAFMHMMMKEENEKYRDLISNTLEFEPEILKRYVNFMSNPDEETAIKQFGTGDKYFGVCLMMITLPGLPMFAHGQIEGFTEKYGMEYKRAYYHEFTNEWLVEKHKREIFPLMKKRYLFSQVYNFWLFDFHDENGHLNENVFAFTNRELNERSLVFFNNKYEGTRGGIFRSSPKLVTRGGNKNQETTDLLHALKLNSGDNHYYVFKEHISGLEFIRSGRDIAENGFRLELNGFEYRVYLDFREVYDDGGKYHELAGKLGSRGVYSIERALREFELEPLHSAFESLFDEESIKGFIHSFILKAKDGGKEKDRIKFIDNKFHYMLNIVKKYSGAKSEINGIIGAFEKDIKAVQNLNEILDEKFDASASAVNMSIHKSIMVSRDVNYRENSTLFMLWAVISNMKKLFPETDAEITTGNFLSALMLDSPVRKILSRFGKGNYELNREIALLDVLLKTESFEPEKSIAAKGEGKDKAKTRPAFHGELTEILEIEAAKNFLAFNIFEGTQYFSKENFEELCDWLLTMKLIVINPDASSTGKTIENEILKLHSWNKTMKEYSVKSGYKVEPLKKMLAGESVEDRHENPGLEKINSQRNEK